MVKQKGKKTMRAGWDDTVKAIAKQAGAPSRASPEKPKRETRQRRAAQKSKANGYNATSDAEALELRAYARLDAMLEVNYLEEHAMRDDDEEFDVEGDEAGTTKQPTTKKKRRLKKAATNAADADAARGKRHKPRSVAQMLSEDFGDGDYDPTVPDYLSIAAPPPLGPPHHVCAVTGAAAPYRDPDTNLPYSDLDSFHLLRENPPSWLKGGNQGSPFYEAVLQIRAARAKFDERRHRPPKAPTAVVVVAAAAAAAYPEEDDEVEDPRTSSAATAPLPTTPHRTRAHPPSTAASHDATSSK